jgi:hypothetical protein
LCYKRQQKCLPLTVLFGARSLGAWMFPVPASGAFHYSARAISGVSLYQNVDGNILSNKFLDKKA